MHDSARQLLVGQRDLRPAPSSGLKLALLLLEQNAALTADGLLHRFGELVQQPGEGHLKAHVVLGDLDIAGRDLA